MERSILHVFFIFRERLFSLNLELCHLARAAGQKGFKNSLSLPSVLGLQMIARFDVDAGYPNLAPGPSIFPGSVIFDIKVVLSIP